METGRASYTEIAQYARRLCVEPRRQNAELFARMVFNILCNNNDDHLRNHGFVYDSNGYVLSPGYDIVPQVQAGESRYLSLGVGVFGKEGSLRNAMSEAGQFGLTDEDARGIVKRIQERARTWRADFESCRVSAKDIAPIEKCFGAVLETGPWNANT